MSTEKKVIVKDLKNIAFNVQVEKLVRAILFDTKAYPEYKNLHNVNPVSGKPLAVTSPQPAELTQVYVGEYNHKRKRFVVPSSVQTQCCLCGIRAYDLLFVLSGLKAKPNVSGEDTPEYFVMSIGAKPDDSDLSPVVVTLESIYVAADYLYRERAVRNMNQVTIDELSKARLND